MLRSQQPAHEVGRDARGGRSRFHLPTALVVSGIVVLTLLPCLYGHLKRPPGSVFLGLVGQNGGDQAFYLGWGAKQAENGHVLFEDKYNGVANRRMVFNPLWLAMGLAARWSHLPVTAVFHVERALFSVLLLLALRNVIGRFLGEGPWPTLALALAAFSGGFGLFRIPVRDWASPAGIFAVPPERWTPDLWVVESNLFLTMLWEVVLPCATFLFFATMASAHATFYGEQGRALRTGLLTLLLGTVYPYAVVSVYGILGLCAVERTLHGRPLRRTLGEYATVLLLGLPVILYDGYLVLADPRLTTGQANYASPDLGSYFLGFGVLSLLAPVGAVLALRHRVDALAFPLVWAAATFVQIYLPLNVVPFQMQLILGVQAPLAILATYALARLYSRWQRTRPAGGAALARGLVTLVFLAALPTSAYHFANVLRGLNRGTLPEYMDGELAQAIRWLEEHADESAVVVSSPEVAPYVPVLANSRMYAGNYGAPTADFPAKLQRIRWLFDERQPKTDAAIVAFLRGNRIEYLFYDRALTDLGGPVPTRIERVPGLTLVFRNQAARIYRLSPSCS